MAGSMKARFSYNKRTYDIEVGLFARPNGTTGPPDPLKLKLDAKPGGTALLILTLKYQYVDPVYDVCHYTVTDVQEL